MRPPRRHLDHALEPPLEPLAERGALHLDRAVPAAVRQRDAGALHAAARLHVAARRLLLRGRRRRRRRRRRRVGRREDQRRLRRRWRRRRRPADDARTRGRRRSPNGRRWWPRVAGRSGVRRRRGRRRGARWRRWRRRRRRLGTAAGRGQQQLEELALGGRRVGPPVDGRAPVLSTSRCSVRPDSPPGGTRSGRFRPRAAPGFGHPRQTSPDCSAKSALF